MNLLYLDQYIAVCEKPSGAISEGTGDNAMPTMLSRHLEKMGETDTNIFPVHRLDRETVGVTVYARTAPAAAALSQAIADGRFEKQYLAILSGVPEVPKGTLTDLLYYDRSRGKSFVVDRSRKGVKRAESDYSVLQAVNGRALVAVKLHTGRTHQIRVQFASRRLPLAGDRRYGAPKDEVPSVALCAYMLTFPHPKTQKSMSFTSKIPDTVPWTDFSTNHLTTVPQDDII